MSKVKNPILGAAILVAAMVPAGAAGAAQSSSVRFVHAVPGAGVATLTAGGETVGDAGFGDHTGYDELPSGQTTVVLAAGGKTVSKQQMSLRPGRHYTVIAMLSGKAVRLRTFADGNAKPGVARLRMIHASPELGRPDVWVGSTRIARKAAYGTATKYWSLAPGTYPVRATAPGNKKRVVLFARAPLAAGTADTAVVVGSRGERENVVLITDDTVAPAAAPEAGLGGLATGGAPGGRPWLAALLAAILAGSAGALVHGRASRSRDEVLRRRV